MYDEAGARRWGPEAEPERGDMRVAASPPTRSMIPAGRSGGFRGPPHPQLAVRLEAGKT